MRSTHYLFYVLAFICFFYASLSFYSKNGELVEHLRRIEQKLPTIPTKEVVENAHESAQEGHKSTPLYGRQWFIGRALTPQNYHTDHKTWVEEVRAVVGNIVQGGVVKLGPTCKLPYENDQFGGVWLDCDDADSKISQLRSLSLITAEEASALTKFRKHGYLVISKAATNKEIDALNEQMEAEWKKKQSIYTVFINGQKHPMSSDIRGKWEHFKGSRVLDAYMGSTEAAKLAMNHKVKRHLALIYTDEPMAFQSLYFEYGSSQPIHQDPAYVVIDEHPKTLTASWIACEDIHEDAGPLHYYEGSNRLPDFIYPGGRLHFDNNHKGMPAIHNSFLTYLTSQSEKMGLNEGKFLAKKGDALIWHSMLAHGGIQVKNPKLTRKSLVTHYCPMSASPNFFNDDQYRKRWKIESGYFASSNFKKPTCTHDPTYL